MGPGKIINKLNQKDVYNLIQICNEFDQSSIELNFNRDQGNVNDLLYYVDELLIGYLVIYPSYKAHEVIINGFVHPHYRKKGIFTCLVEEAKRLVKENNRNKMIFIIDHLSQSGKQFLESIHATFTMSSYNLFYDVEFTLNDSLNVEIIEPSLEQVEDLVRIGIEAFDTKEEEERPLAVKNLTLDNRRVLAAKIEGKLVGFVVTVKNGEQATICDLSVLKDFRHKGIGSTLLSESIRRLLKEDIVDIRLGVYTNNEGAVRLYERNGFVIYKSEDFYELSI